MLVTINLASKEAPSGKVREPLVDGLKRRNEMPDAVKVAIVRAGAFYIGSDEVLKVLAPRVQYMEFAEMYGDREREERLVYGGKHQKKLHVKVLRQFDAALQKAGDAEILEFLEKGQLGIPAGPKWVSDNVCRAAVKALVLVLDKKPEDVTADDFRNNALYGLLHHYHGSPYEALKDAGFEIKPWEMNIAPQGFYKARENRIAAICWLANKLDKEPRDIERRDFDKNGIRGMLVGYYGDSPFMALLEAGLVTDADEEYMRMRSLKNLELGRVARLNPPSEGVEN